MNRLYAYKTETGAHYVSAMDIGEAIEIACGESGNVQAVYELEYVEYGFGTFAFFDCETDSYFNHFGQRLSDISKHDQYGEGYTPFGDE